VEQYRYVAAAAAPTQLRRRAAAAAAAAAVTVLTPPSTPHTAAWEFSPAQQRQRIVGSLRSRRTNFVVLKTSALSVVLLFCEHQRN